MHFAQCSKNNQLTTNWMENYIQLAEEQLDKLFYKLEPSWKVSKINL